MVWPCSILPMRDEVPNWVVVVESTGVRGSCDLDAVGVKTSVWFVRGGRTPEDYCLVGQGLCNGEVADILGGL